MTGTVAREDDQQALEEALERLLDPLAEDPPAAVEEEPERPLPPLPPFVPASEWPRPSVRDLAVRLRRSERGVFPIARRMVSWAVGLAAFWAAVWVILSVGGVR